MTASATASMIDTASTNEHYPHLFEPLDLGFTTLKTVWSWVLCIQDLKTVFIITVSWLLILQSVPKAAWL
ncbi:hypothetical protein Psyaliredsea_02900 [Psychrobacter alimentarius]